MAIQTYKGNIQEFPAKTSTWTEDLY
jgi:hypothetical protein